MGNGSVIPPFIPLQPEVDKLTRGCGEVAVPRSPLLREYVAYYFSMQTPGDPRKPLIMHGVPDGCVDLMLHADLGASSLMGLASQPVFIPVTGNARYFGIRFLPGKIHHFLHLPAKGFYDRSWSARELVGPKLDAVQDALLRTESFRRRTGIAETALLRLLERNGFEEDPRYLDAVDQIYRSRGAVDVRTLAGTQGISDRHLRRLFDETLGLSPKRLARVVRFQVALNRLQGESIRSLLDLSLSLGYYDQSHFINDFRQLYGRTPSRLERADPSVASMSGFSKTSLPAAG